MCRSQERKCEFAGYGQVCNAPPSYKGPCPKKVENHVQGARSCRACVLMWNARPLLQAGVEVQLVVQKKQAAGSGVFCFQWMRQAGQLKKRQRLSMSTMLQALSLRVAHAAS